MSNRSFIDRAAEERGQGLIVGRVVLRHVIHGARLVGGLELIEHGLDGFIRIGGLALPLHRVEIVHIGRIGLFIVAEQTHRMSRRLTVSVAYSTTFGTRKKWFSIAGAFVKTSSAISPSLTTACRFFISIGIT